MHYLPRLRLTTGVAILIAVQVSCHSDPTTPPIASAIGTFSMQYLGVYPLPLPLGGRSYFWADSLDVSANSVVQRTILRDSLPEGVKITRLLGQHTAVISHDTLIIMRASGTETLSVAVDGLRSRRRDPEHTCGTTGSCDVFYRRVP
ncbi:MAG: hypothetical protein U0132_14075 [Gemmatimonadaceae bacterium]